jgi:hypothetical protein
MKKSIIFSFLATCFFLQEGEAKWCADKAPRDCLTEEAARKYIKGGCNSPQKCLDTYRRSNNENNPAVWSFLEEMRSVIADQKRRSASSGFENTPAFKEHQRRSEENRKRAMKEGGLFQGQE